MRRNGIINRFFGGSGMKPEKMILFGIVAYFLYKHFSSTAHPNPQPGDPNFVGPVQVGDFGLCPDGSPATSVGCPTGSLQSYVTD